VAFVRYFCIDAVRGDLHSFRRAAFAGCTIRFLSIMDSQSLCETA